VKGDTDVAGRLGYGILKSRGLFAVRCRPPDGLSLIYEASGLAFWRYSNSRFDFDSLISDGTAILAIRTPPGVMETLPKSPRRPRQRMRSAVRALTALRGDHYLGL